MFGLKILVGIGYRLDYEENVWDIDDVMEVLRLDYGNVYFVIGMWL